MFARLLRSTITLAALVVVYQVYVLTVAPIVEPPAVAKSAKQIDDQNREDSYAAIGRYQRLLAAYFPSDHWSLTSPPKVIRLDKLMLVLKDYRRHDDGSIDLDECAVLVLPADWEFGEPPPLDTVVLEAPGGAHLQFDEDFQPTRGKAGRIVDGRFPGDIVIRSKMRDPGPDDDLLITTRDLSMNEMLIRTDAEVDAWFGPNHGSGRKMEIRLSRDKHIRRGPSINGVQSLEVLENVKLDLDLGEVDLLGTESAGDKVARITPATSAYGIQLTSAHTPTGPPAPQVQITCKGRFHFDALNYVASFDQQVVVKRMRLDGPYDQLDCSELTVHFSPVDDNGAPISSDDPDLTRRQRKAVRRFKPVAVTATGYPVRAESAVEGASARANRMRIDLYARTLTLDEGNEVRLDYGASFVRAPFIKYELPDAKSTHAVGELYVAGPGVLRAVPDRERADRVVDVAWKASADTRFPVQLVREQGQPVLKLAGDPVIDAHRLGRIGARRIEVELREVPADGPQGPAFEITNDPGKLAIIPERMLAAGEVNFASPKLKGRTHQLEGNFEPWRPVGDAPLSQASTQTAGPTPTSPAATPDRKVTQYDLTANQIHLDLALSGRTAEPTNVTCDGSVEFREVQPSEPGEKPLVVRGTQLAVRELDADAKITVTGRRDPQLGGPGTATIAARGLTLAAERINADQATGKFWINGPGLATMNVDGATFGQPAGTTTPVSLTWQTGLDAAGKKIVASGRVLAESQHGWVQADRAIATLTRPVTVERDAAEGKIEVAQVTLEGNVVGDHRGQDEQGQTSHENFQLEDSITYDRLSGNVQGKGRGTLRSVRLSDNPASFADLASASSPSRAATQKKASGSKIRFLRVDFAEGLTGNVNQRVVRFHRRVQSVYGPVDDWQQELPLHAPDRLPADTVTLACETLEVNEDPLGRRPGTPKGELGPLEIRALENVEIEGRSEKNGVFQAQSVVASYSQTKDLFVLEGDGQRDAVLYHRDPLTGRYLSTPAGTILYYRSEPRVELRDVHRPIDFQQSTPRAADERRPVTSGPIR